MWPSTEFVSMEFVGIKNATKDGKPEENILFTIEKVAYQTHPYCS